MSSEARESEATEGRGRQKVPERGSTQRKVEVVLRLLRGETAVSCFNAVFNGG